MNKTKLIALVGFIAGISLSGVAFGMGKDGSPKKSRKRPEQPNKIYVQRDGTNFTRINKYGEELKGSWHSKTIKIGGETIRTVEFEKYDK